MLADRYPRCFFDDPRQRLPLAKNLLTDLQKDGFPVASELLTAALDWYQGHFGYLYRLQAGARRFGLDGSEVGTVTEQEQANAQKKVAEGKAKVRSWQADPVRTLNGLHAAGRIADDQLKKLDAPPMPVRPTPTSAPELAPVYKALTEANAALASASARLRSAIVAAALGVVIEEAQRVIAGFTQAAE
jgi:sRNA-binding protein